MENRPEITNMAWNILLVLTCISITSVVPSHSKAESKDVSGEGLESKLGGKLVLGASCLDYPSCQLDLELLKKAVESRRTWEACGHARASFRCQRSATKLCEKGGLLNEDTLDKMKRAYIYTEIYLQEMCHHSSSLDTKVSKGGSHCSEFRSCFVEVKQYKAAVHSNMYHEACRLATRIYQCSSSAMLDCRERGNLSQEALNLMEDTTVQAGSRVDSICPLTTTTAPPPHEVSHQCFDYASCPKPDLDILQLAKINGLFDDACRTITPHTLCLRQTVEDCEEKRLVSGIAMLSMKESLRRANKNFEMFCPFYESDVDIGRIILPDQESQTGSAATFDLRTTDPHLTCLDLGSCPKPYHPQTEKSNKRNNQLDCQLWKVFTTCIDQATDDCKARNLITGSAYDSMVRTVKEAKQRTEYFCRKSKDTCSIVVPDQLSLWKSKSSHIVL